MSTTSEKNDLTAVQQRALSGFDNLPDAAQIDVQVVAALCGLSVPTAWRLARTGKLPTPTRLTAGSTRWRVGAVREWLSRAAAPADRTVRGSKGKFAVDAADGTARGVAL